MELDALLGVGTYRDQPGGVAAQPSAFVEATVATTPVAVTDEVYVFLDVERAQLAPDQAAQRLGPCRWHPRPVDGGLLFPKRDDRCLVVTSDRGHRHIVWWEPKTPRPSLLLTSLPASPFDGQEIYFAADQASGVNWRLRYNAASASPYKWEVIGPAAIADGADGAGATFTTASPAYTLTYWATPTITVPLAGDYDIDVMAYGFGAGTACGDFRIAAGAFTGTITGPAYLHGWLSLPGSGGFEKQETMRVTLTAGAVVRIAYYSSPALVPFAGYGRLLKITPVRVG